MLIKVEAEMKEYIKENVEEDFRRKKGKFFSQDMYEDIMKTCLEIMEE